MGYKNERDGIRSVSNDLRALQGAGYDTQDAGTKMSNRDIQRSSTDSGRATAAAGHQARNDMAKDGGWGVPTDRHGDKSSNDDGRSSHSGDSGK